MVRCVMPLGAGKGPRSHHDNDRDNNEREGSPVGRTDLFAQVEEIERYEDGDRNDLLQDLDIPLLRPQELLYAIPAKSR